MSATNKVIFDVCEAGFAYPDGPPALKGATLKIVAGEHAALIGSNGAGKSTLLKLLGGILFPTEGSVAFEGTLLTHMHLDHDADFRRSFRSRVGYLFQNSDVQLFCPTVREEVAFGPMQTMSRDEALERTWETMRMLEVDRLADEAPYALSGGEKRRVALATVLVMKPDVLLLDEPTANLDPKTCERLYDVLDEYASDSSKTVITATHDLAAARALAKTCAVLTPTHEIALHASAEEVLNDESLLREVNLIGSRRRG